MEGGRREPPTFESLEKAQPVPGLIAQNDNNFI